MPRIILAHWHDGRAPGTELEVSDEKLAALQRDGRVAAVVNSPDAQPESSAPQDQAAEPEPEHAAAPEEPAPASRKRR